jgi:glycosyltransferase involved in cell wall biosynthesis
VRILVANDGLSDAGGVQTYLEAVIPALMDRGHDLLFGYSTGLGGGEPHSRLRRIRLSGQSAAESYQEIRNWAPDICYSHNMNDLAVDERLADVAPVIKFMHGYFGTCISGLKTHAFPRPVACTRRLGIACLGLYFPRRCGRLRPTTLIPLWRWTQRQRALAARYSAIVVASEHMRREYSELSDRVPVHVNPLFASNAPDLDTLPPAPSVPHVMFMGRMTHLKGGDVLLKAVRHAIGLLGTNVQVTLIGDGPQRAAWERLAHELNLNATFTGWVERPAAMETLQRASVLAVPSVWPEPFGLTGLEGGALGVPAVAFRIGGVTEWLRDGINGVTVANPPSATAFGSGIASVLGDPPLLARLRQGAVRIAKEMSLALHVSRLEALFESVAATRLQAVV